MFDEKSWFSKYFSTLSRRAKAETPVKSLDDLEINEREEEEHEKKEKLAKDESRELLLKNQWLFDSQVNNKREFLSEDEFILLDNDESTLILSETEQKKSCTDCLKSAGNNRKVRNFLRKIPYYIPILDWLPSYNIRADLLSDLLAGITVASVVIPQGIAYSTLANVAPVVGLYTAWMPMVTYTLLGTSRQLAIGPEGVVSLLVGDAVTDSPIPDGEDFYDVTYQRATLLALMCGIFTLILGLFRVGFLDNLISRPILHGFVSASAMVILVGQLDKFLGFSVPQQEWKKIIGVLENLDLINWASTIIGISSIIIIVGLDFFKRKVGGVARYIPTSLLVVILMTVLCWAFDLAERYNVVVLSLVQGGFPKVQLPPIWDLEMVSELTVQAILISIVGFVESNAIGKTYATINGYDISANRELVAFGYSNVVSSFFGSFPAFGSLSRSNIAQTAGSKTQLFGFFGSILVLLCILFLMPLFQDLPKSAIAGIVIVAAARLVSFHWAELFQLQAWLEIFLTIFTFVTTFFLGAQIGIILALAISIFLVVKHVTLPSIVILGRTNQGKWIDINETVDQVETFTFQGVVVIRLDESLYFGNIEQIVKMIRRIVNLGSTTIHPSSPSLHPNKIEFVIIDGRNIHKIDANAVSVLKEMIVELHRRKGVRVYFAHLKDKHLALFKRAHIHKLIDGETLQKSINKALLRARNIQVNSSPNIVKHASLNLSQSVFESYSRNSHSSNFMNNNNNYDEYEEVQHKSGHLDQLIHQSLQLKKDEIHDDDSTDGESAIFRLGEVKEQNNNHHDDHSGHSSFPV